MLECALFVNFIIVICELYTLEQIKEKRNIFKYYTYLQNLLALIVSLIFSVILIVCMATDRVVPEYVKGLRYIATCGLVATMFIFIAFLGAGKKISITQDDFLFGCSPKIANYILHYICPILSLLSFVLFERELPLSDGIWTSIAAIPSCLYWIIYIVLSATKSWEEPYNFSSQGDKSSLSEYLPFLLIPLSFIAFSFILWNVR